MLKKQETILRLRQKLSGGLHPQTLSPEVSAQANMVMGAGKESDLEQGGDFDLRENSIDDRQLAQETAGGASGHVVFAIVILGAPTSIYLGVVSLLPHLRDASDAPGLGAVVAYVSSEALLMVVAIVQRHAAALGPRQSALISVGRMLLVLCFIGWHSVLLAYASAAVTRIAVADAALAGIGVFGWLVQRRLREVEQANFASNAEAKELRVQYEALRELVKIRLVGYYSDSEDERDERENLIKPPAPVTLSKAYAPQYPTPPPL